MSAAGGLLQAAIRAFFARSAPRQNSSSSVPAGSPVVAPSVASAPRALPKPAELAVKTSESRPASPAKSGEGRLVRDLFGNPQSLVAAFIAAEILATPVALRER